MLLTEQPIPYTEEHQNSEILDKETLHGSDICAHQFDDTTPEERLDVLMANRPHTMQLG